jgi:hypothetical protein
MPYFGKVTWAYRGLLLGPASAELRFASDSLRLTPELSSSFELDPGVLIAG